jgi:hypothetical protein
VLIVADQGRAPRLVPIPVRTGDKHQP